MLRIFSLPTMNYKYQQRMYRCNLEDQKHLSYLKNVTKYTSEYVQNCYTAVVDQLNTTECTFDGKLTMPLKSVPS